MYWVYRQTVGCTCSFLRKGSGEILRVAILIFMYLLIHLFNFIEPSHHLEVYHGYMASSYHTGILSGFVLISSYMESLTAAGKSVSTAT